MLVFGGVSEAGASFYVTRKKNHPRQHKLHKLAVPPAMRPWAVLEKIHREKFEQQMGPEKKNIECMYGIFTYTYHKNQSNLGKYTNPMDPMGMDLTGRGFRALGELWNFQALNPSSLGWSEWNLPWHVKFSSRRCGLNSGWGIAPKMVVIVREVSPKITLIQVQEFQ